MSRAPGMSPPATAAPLPSAIKRASAARIVAGCFRLFIAGPFREVISAGEGLVKRRTEYGGSPFRAGISPYSAKLQRGSDTRTARAAVPDEAGLNAILCSGFALSAQARRERTANRTRLPPPLR